MPQQTARQNQLRLISAGAFLVMATDAWNPCPDFLAQTRPEVWNIRTEALGEGHFNWCQGMAEMGVSPMNILMAATRNVAIAYHKIDDLGTLEKGKLADLVVLEADPLADMQNLRKIFLVMKEGKVVEREKLPIIKVLTSPQPPKKYEHP